MLIYNYLIYSILNDLLKRYEQKLQNNEQDGVKLS